MSVPTAPCSVPRTTRRTGVALTLALTAGGMAVIAPRVEAEELLPYKPPSVRIEMQQQQAPRRVAPQQQNIVTPRITEGARQDRAEYYRRRAEQAHRNKDDVAERYYLRQWRKYAGAGR